MCGAICGKSRRTKRTGERGTGGDLSDSVTCWYHETMPKYMFIFRGGAPERPARSPPETETHLRKWYAWAGELAKAGGIQASNRSTTPAKRFEAGNRLLLMGRTRNRRTWSGSLVIDAVSL